MRESGLSAQSQQPNMRSQTMWPPILRILIGWPRWSLLAVAAAGCGGTPRGQGRPAPVARPSRASKSCGPMRARSGASIEQPGQIEAYEVTAIHAKVSGYVQKWNTDIGSKVTRGQVLAVLSVPELDAEVEQKQALIEEAEAKVTQARASEDVAQANLVSTRAKLEEVQAGIKRADADVARWQSEFHRIEELFHQRAQTGSLLDETRSKLRSSESTRDGGRSPDPHGRGRGPAGHGHARQGPRRRESRHGEHQGRHIRCATDPGARESMKRSSHLTTESSPGDTSTSAT